MIRPDDRDDAMRELLRQPRPSAVDPVRTARVYRAVHAAWRDSADRRRNRRRGVAFAAAAVLVTAIGLTVVNWPRNPVPPQANAPIASTLFVTSEVVFQHDGRARAGRVGEALTPGTHIATYGGRAAIVRPDHASTFFPAACRAANASRNASRARVNSDSAALGVHCKRPAMSSTLNSSRYFHSSARL